MIYFVTGTDTDSGKTFISSALLAKAKAQGLSTQGFKPIASGCELIEQQLRNADALALMKHSTLALPYCTVNPIAFAPAIAPHIAAIQQGVDLSAQFVADNLDIQNLFRAEFTLIEGAGGWRLPLKYHANGKWDYLPQTIALWQQGIKQQGAELQVILVVGMKLGCLNHAMLTIEAILQDNFTIAGWVANQVDGKMAEIEANLQSLKTMIDAPFLGYVPHLQEHSPEKVSQFLHLPA